MNDKKLEYFLYARKSTESEDRQIQSIGDQINRLKQVAGNLGIKVKKVYTEAKSAKKPGIRPIFSEMMERIEKGEADGILCWQINRLSRNPVDSGRISWLLQQGLIKSIQTVDRQYRPEDNVLIFSVESGVANQFILDLSKNVKRGIQSKLEKGWKPGLPPTGYKNDFENHTIVKDKERFELIRRAWDIFLTGNYTVPQVLDKLNGEWGFRTIKRKRIGGGPLALSGLYRIFTDLFYAGVIIHQGKEYAGRHEPMISLTEFDYAQSILGRKGKPRSKKYKFAFTGMMVCGECGCAITAETKAKHIKCANERREYTYYHCTKRKVGVHCSQKPISETNLEKQIEDKINSITILPVFRDWALETLNMMNDKEISERNAIYETQQKTLIGKQKELDNLTKLRLRDLLDDEEYLGQKITLQREVARLRENVHETESRADNWLKTTEKVFNFSTNAIRMFKDGDLETKKAVLAALGQHFILKDGVIDITLKEWLKPIQESYPALEKEYNRLELTKFASINGKNTAFDDVFSTWQGR